MLRKLASAIVFGVAVWIGWEMSSSVGWGVEPTKLVAKHLPNPVRVHPRVISGGLPEGDEAFAELKALGVRTIVSVDGAVPDVAAAKRYGLKYVHLPHGYDGIPESRVRELAKAVRSLEGPLYIHCHLGKHRSPAAASAACVAAGLLPAADALDVLKVAGTNPKYRGLFQSVANSRPIPAEELQRLTVHFREREAVPPLVTAMVALESTHDRLKASAAGGWKRSATDDPAHHALLLREHFAEMLRLQETQRFPKEFAGLLRESQTLAERLEQEFPRQPVSPSESARASLDKRLGEINDRCVRCHERFRDTR